MNNASKQLIKSLVGLAVAGTYLNSAMPERPPRETPKTYCHKCDIPMNRASKKKYKCPKCGKFEKIKVNK